MAELIRLAFGLSSTKIRCTSVKGFGLSAGDKTGEQLRKGIVDAPVFIALMTPNSVRAEYVLVEIGARWGTEKVLMPVVARGFRASALPKAIADLNAPDISQRADVLELLGTIENHLRRPQEPGSSTAKAVDAVVSAASITAAAAPAEGAAPGDTEWIRNALRDVLLLARAWEKRK